MEKLADIRGYPGHEHCYIDMGFLHDLLCNIPVYSVDILEENILAYPLVILPVSPHGKPSNEYFPTRGQMTGCYGGTRDEKGRKEGERPSGRGGGKTETILGTLGFFFDDRHVENAYFFCPLFSINQPAAAGRRTAAEDRKKGKNENGGGEEKICYMNKWGGGQTVIFFFFSPNLCVPFGSPLTKHWAIN